MHTTAALTVVLSASRGVAGAGGYLGIQCRLNCNISSGACDTTVFVVVVCTLRHLFFHFVHVVVVVVVIRLFYVYLVSRFFYCASTT